MQTGTVQMRPVSGPTKPTAHDSQLMTQARALEAGFLSEMLGYAGAAKASDSFGGGIGEEQFSSFLRDEEARQMVAHGGIGLAERLFHAMQKGPKE